MFFLPPPTFFSKKKNIWMKKRKSSHLETITLLIPANWNRLSIYIYSCWFCWTRCCVPSKNRFQIFNFLIIYITSSRNMYYTHRYILLFFCAVHERELGGKKIVSDDVDIHARWTHDLQKSRRMKISVYISLSAPFPCWVIFTELSIHLYTHDVELRIIHSWKLRQNNLYIPQQQQHLKYLFPFLFCFVLFC